MNSKAYDGLTGEKATGNCLSSIRISLLEKQQSILK
jgi:hypothetical protein